MLREPRATHLRGRSALHQVRAGEGRRTGQNENGEICRAATHHPSARYSTAMTSRPVIPPLDISLPFTVTVSAAIVFTLS